MVKHIFDYLFHLPNRPKSARLQGFRRFLLSGGANTVYAPKCRALPTAPHPEIFCFFCVKVIAEICAKRSHRESNSKITRCWVFGKCRKAKNCKRVSVFWRFVGCSPSGENSESVLRPRGAKDSVSFEYPYIIAKKCRVVNRQSDCS